MKNKYKNIFIYIYKQITNFDIYYQATKQAQIIAI